MIPRPEKRSPARLPLTAIRPDPEQPRKEFDWDRLKDLAASIRSNGQWVRIIVRPDPDREGGYILVDGERRWRAMPLVPSNEIDAEIVEGPLDAKQLLLVQTSLGLSAEKLDPLEMGEACQRLMGMFDLTPRELAEKLGTSESTLSKLFCLQNCICESLKSDVKSGVLGFTVAYHVSRLPRAEDQVRIADLFKNGFLSRDGLAAEVAQILRGGKPKAKSKRCKVKDGDTCIDIPAAATWEHVKAFGAKLLKAAAQGEKSIGVLPSMALQSILKSI
jgi:ParB family transcriptional regulator, chromosome partitioning protein